MQTFPVEINGLAEKRQFVPQLQFQSGAHILHGGGYQRQRRLQREANAI